MMAFRQQQQIDTQHQLLAAKEQRLRFLKSQEACETIAVAEGERLRRLRERVEAQESKLRRLRALRGQVDLQKTYNITLGNDLDTIRALFSEKEKELTLAVAKVEALTRQLEEIRRDRRGSLNLFAGLPNHSQLNSSAAAVELEKLKQELMYRNQLSVQQDARLQLQREALQKRQAELQSVDERILELQGRLNKKKISNMAQQQSISSQGSQKYICSDHVRSTSSNFYPQRVPRSNIVAVEPFNHIPQKNVSLCRNGSKTNILSNTNDTNSNNVTQTQISQDMPNIKFQKLCSTTTADPNLFVESDENKLAAKQKRQECMLNSSIDYDYDASFTAKQSQIPKSHNILNESEGIPSDDLVLDNKYYFNRDYNINNVGNSNENNNDLLDKNTNECDSDKVSDSSGIASRTQHTVTVHSTPMIFSNKSVAVPVVLSNTIGPRSVNNNCRGFAHNLLHNIPSGNLVVPPRNPNNNVGVAKYALSDIKVNKVMPQAQKSTYMTSSTETTEKMKPALPPKPSKSNSLQSGLETTYHCMADSVNNIEQSSGALNNNNKSGNINLLENLPIKAKPLTIKKSPHCEQPKLRHSSCNVNSYKAQLQCINRVTDIQAMGNADDTETVHIQREKGENVEMQLENPCASTKHISNGNTSDCSVCDDRSDQSYDKRIEEITRRKRNFASTVLTDGKIKLARRVSFDPLALLLDASLEGELELVQKTALQVSCINLFILKSVS
ncbi:putative uncharacterized protein DDB_G0282133 isoform X2 [Topomyia yanbarensis]|nr:putative uncharacterized protein DDB_G0282133 isoform X2 [Topomyia yanbarensis]